MALRYYETPEKNSFMTFISQLPNFTIALIGLVLLAPVVSGETLAQAFEIRYFTSNAAANGETDFKGKTVFLTTGQRVDFLRAYAEYGRLYWNDPRLDKKVFPLSEARMRTRQIKPQPRPQVRIRLLEDEWAWQGQLTQKSAKQEAVWTSPDLRGENGRLDFLKAAKALSITVNQPAAPNSDGFKIVPIDRRQTI